MLVFLPPLIFDGCFNTDWYVFKKEFIQINILAFPGVLITALLIGVAFKYILHYEGFSITEAFMLGSILSATDPVAVIALLKEVSAPRPLSTLIEGESILNDGTAMVCLKIFMVFVKGESTNAGLIIGQLCRLTLGAFVFGLIVGMVIIRWIERLFSDSVLVISVTVFSAYLVFYTSEMTELHVSGVLAVCTLGLYMSTRGKAKISPFAIEGLHEFWKYASYVAETIIFVIIGIVLGGTVILGEQSVIDYTDWLKLLGFFLILNAVRLIMMLISWPFLQLSGYPVNWKSLLICTYAGLRGGVALALSLVISVDESINPYVRQQVLFHVAGLAFLTIMINGITTHPILNLLKLSKPAEVKDKVMIQYLKGLSRIYKDNVEEIMSRRHYKRVNWSSIKNLTGMDEFENLLADLEPKAQQQALNYNTAEIMIEGKFRFLMTIKSMYWHCIEEYQASAASVRILRECVDRALDDPDYPIDSWDMIVQYLTFDYYEKIMHCLSAMPLLGTLFKWVLTRHVAFCYETAAIYIISLMEAQCSFTSISSDVNVLEKIRGDVRAEISKATAYIKSRIITDFPEIASAVQTRMASMVILNRLREHTNEFLEKGLLEEREYNSVMDIIDSKIYLLNLNPPKASLPDIKEEIRNHKLLKELLEQNEENWEHLIKSSSPMNTYEGKLLYKAGEKEKTVLAVIKGKAIKRLSVPEDEGPPVTLTKSSGDFLGLYEYLTRNEKRLSDCVSHNCLVYLAIPWEILDQYANTPVKRAKLWYSISAFILRYHIIQLPVLDEFNIEDIERLVKFCKCIIIENGEKADATDGCIILHGEARRITIQEDTLIQDPEKLKACSFVKPVHGFIKCEDSSCVVLKLPTEIRDLWETPVSRSRMRGIISTTEPTLSRQRARSYSLSMGAMVEEIHIQINQSKQISDHMNIQGFEESGF